MIINNIMNRNNRHMNNNLVNKFQSYMNTNTPFQKNPLLNNNPTFMSNSQDSSFFNKINVTKLEQIKRARNIEEIGLDKNQLTDIIISPITINKTNKKELLVSSPSVAASELRDLRVGRSQLIRKVEYQL